MKVFKFVILWIAVSSLWGEVIVLKDGTKIECTILTTKNDSLIVINRITEKVDKIAFDAILRIEKLPDPIAKVDKSIEFGFLGGVIGGLAAFSLKQIAGLEDPRIAAPLYGLCISCGIVIGVEEGRK